MLRQVRQVRQVHYICFDEYNHKLNHTIMAKIVSITNFKGGVGKTTSTINLGGALALKGKRVLLVDLDPQCNLTDHLNVDTDYSNIKEILTEKSYNDDIYYNEVRENLFVAPANMDMATADTLMIGILYGRELMLKNALSKVSDKFDFILIDCPPNLGILPHNAYFASDIIIAIVETEIYPLKGYSMLSQTIKYLDRDIDGVFLTKHDARTRLHKDVAASLEDSLGDLVFKTKIRSNIALAEAPANNSTIFDYDDTCHGAEDYKDLADEFIKRFENNSH